MEGKPSPQQSLLFPRPEQLSLMNQRPTPPQKNKKPDTTPLDALFQEVGTYRQSAEYKQLLEFIAKLGNLAPFNAMLVHMQKPGVKYVATAPDWRKKFNRYPKRNARPLVILWPFAPVSFVFDLEETEGDRVPDAALDFFATRGSISEELLYRTVHAARKYGVTVREEKDAPSSSAGCIFSITPAMQERYKDLGFPVGSRFGLVLNGKHSLATRYATLVHELAHLFCGHLGFREDDWWKNQRGFVHEPIREVEAESVAWLVCKRHGLEPPSSRYLDQYMNGHAPELPSIWLYRMLMAADEIENMGCVGWRQKKPRK